MAGDGRARFVVLAFSVSRFLRVGHSRILTRSESCVPARIDATHPGHFLADTPACLPYRNIARR